MNAIHPTQTDHPPEQTRTAAAVIELPEIPGAPLADRIAMRIGIWLLRHSIRNHVPEPIARREAELQRVSDAARAEHEAAIARARIRGAGAPHQL